MTALYLEDFAVGQTFGTQVLTVTEEEIIRFAREFDPQPFHIDPALAQTTFFRGLAASGWHTAALTMRLLVGGDMTPAHGIIGAGFDSLTWPRPVRPSDTLQVLSEVLDGVDSGWVQNSTLSTEDALAVVSQIAVRVDVAIESNGPHT